MMIIIIVVIIMTAAKLSRFRSRSHWGLFLGSILDVPKPKRNGLVKKISPFSKRNNPL